VNRQLPALKGFGWPGFKPMKLWRQDKGQRGLRNGIHRSNCQGWLNAASFQSFGRSDPGLPLMWPISWADWVLFAILQFLVFIHRDVID
jgi:hypothetical protein